MRKVFYLTLLISQVFWAQSAFEKGNEFYQKENYKAAIESYESIVDDGLQSPELYFNLGNCYYKLHKVAPAIYNYEKALMLSPNDVEIQTNLDFARKMTIDEIKEIPKVGFNKLIQDFTSSFHYDYWAWITICISFVFLLCFLGYYFSQIALVKKVFFVGMFFMLFGVILSFSAGMLEKKNYQNELPAIVFKEEVAVKSEPKLNGPDAFVLHEGTKVFVLESIANWKKIQLADQTIGWIEESAIKMLK